MTDLRNTVPTSGTDADLIDPTRDRVWAIDVTVRYTTYAVAETGAKAEEIADDAADEDLRLACRSEEYRARELTEPQGDDGEVVAWGHSLWDDRQLTVGEVIDLIASARPVHDTQTLLMPFVDALTPALRALPGVPA